jgi:hypothetical protein
VFFYAQKHTVDFAVSQIPDGFKKNSILLSVFKENVFFNKNHIKGVTDDNTQPSSNEKIFLSTLPIVNISNDKYINALTVNQKQLFGNNIVAKLENADKELAKLEFNLISMQLRGMWDEYKKALKISSNTKFKPSEQQKARAAKLYTSLNIQSLNLYRKYRNRVIGFLSNGETDDFINSTFSNDGVFYPHYEKARYMNGYIEEYHHASSLRDLNQAINNIESFNSVDNFFGYFSSVLYEHFNAPAEISVRFSISKAHKFLGLSHPKSKSLLDSFLLEINSIKGSRGSLCYESNLLPNVKLGHEFRETNKLNKDIKYGLLVFGTKNKKYLYNSYEIDDDSLDKKYLICDTTQIESEIRKSFMKFAVKINKFYFGFDRDVNSYKRYIKTTFGKKDIQNLYRSQNIIVPLGFNPSDKKAFEKYYKESFKNRAKNIITSKLVAMANMNVSSYVRKYGEISTSLNETEFYRLPIIQMILDKKFPQMVRKNGYIMMNYSDSRKTPKWHKDAISNKDKIISDFIKNKEKYNGGYLYQVYNSKIEDDRIMDLYAKSIVVPTFVLFISTIMIVINIINLILLFLNTKSTKKKLFVLSTILILFLSLSMFNDNNKYTNYYQSIKGDTNEYLIVLASVLQNTNSLFESIGFFNDTINKQIDNFESYAIVDNVDGYIVAKKYKEKTGN